MTHFIREGANFQVAPKQALDIHKTLPVGTYAVKLNPMTNAYFLEVIEDLTFSGKIYGDTTKHADKIFRTFEHRPNSTGVLLNGEKGSGKTLLAKMLSIKGYAKGMPTIVINQPHYGEGFNTFMQMIDQPTVVLFDEFEKVYDSDEQERMLTLLDGVYPSKKLFVLTCNDKYRINSMMLNRPGRIFYRLEYRGLDANFIREYAEDNLAPEGKKYIDSLTRLSSLFTKFNFDMLKAIVEEMNRYDESPEEVMSLLNARPEHNEDTTYKVEMLWVDDKGNPVTDKYVLGTTRWAGNPFMPEDGEIYVAYREIDSRNGWDQAAFLPSDLVSIDENTGALTFVNNEGHRLTLKQQQQNNNSNFYRFAF